MNALTNPSDHLRKTARERIDAVTVHGDPRLGERRGMAEGRVSEYTVARRREPNTNPDQERGVSSGGGVPRMARRQESYRWHRSTSWESIARPLRGLLSMRSPRRLGSGACSAFAVGPRPFGQEGPEAIPRPPVAVGLAMACDLKLHRCNGSRRMAQPFLRE